MKSLSEIEQQIEAVLSGAWSRRSGQVVPDPEDLRLGNDSVELDATVLYADLADSTGLVMGYKDWFAASVYKMYLLSAAELIRNNQGSITAYDGDRVMAVFIGEGRSSLAAKCALQIGYVVSQVITPAIKRKFDNVAFELKQAVGIDSSKLLVSRTGVWGNNDLVWVGRAANYASKLCGLRDGSFATFITSEVYEALAESSRYGGDPRQDMWTRFIWAESGLVAYKSNWRWKPE